MPDPGDPTRRPVHEGWFTVAILGAIVGIGPIAVLVAFGLFMLPFQIAWLFTEPLYDEGPWLVISYVLTGTIGLSVLVYVLVMLVLNRPIRRAYPILAATAVGIVATTKFGVGADLSGKAVAAAALLATSFILWLVWPLMWAPSKRWPAMPDLGDVLCIVILGLIGTMLFSRPTLRLASQNLSQYQQRWMERRPAEYEFELWFAGSNLPLELSMPRRVHVRGTEVISMEPAVTGPLQPTSRWTMDTLYDALLDAQRHGHRVRAIFDETGYIEKARVETKNGPEGWEVEVRQFQAPESSTGP